MARLLSVGVRLLLVAYLLVCGWFYLFQESVLMAPNVATTDAPVPIEKLQQAGPLSREYVLLPPSHAEDGASLHCRYYPCAGAEPARGVVAYLHGNRGNLHECRFQVEIFLDAGYDVALMDYRSYGYSRGPVSEAALCADALYWYDDLAARQAPGQPVVVWGRSFGTGLAAHVAAHREPQLLVLETPYDSLVDCVREQSLLARLLPRALFRYDFPTWQLVPQVRCPVHLIHGDQDERIPYAASLRLKSLCDQHQVPCTLWKAPGGKHNLRPSPAETAPKFAAALRAILTPAANSPDQE